MRETLRTHLIDLDSAGVLEDDYAKFFNYRCERIAQELDKVLIRQEGDQDFQSPNYEDFEDFETSQRLGIELDEE